MWYLTSANDSRIIYVLPGQDAIIGRSADGQNCNFAVPGDPSLSRKHASLSIVDNQLNLQDLGSKYGTFVNNSSDKLECNKKIVLQENDMVKFGKMNCDWKVQKSQLVSCTSTLKGENILNLRAIMEKLGGELKSDWDEFCTFLTMPAITLTIKVVLALVQGAYIVTTDYWNKCLDAVSQNAKLPDPKLFTPQIIESTLNKEAVSFLPSEVRKTLFNGKKVIFFSKRQLDMYKMVLERSSATALLLSETKMSKLMLCAEDVIVIQYNITSSSQETESQREQIKDIVNYLKSKGKRVAADAEIGLAILYCSLEKYCNPDFNFTLEVIKQSSGSTATANNILAPESQNPSQAILKRENIKIDESLTGHDNSLTVTGNETSGKRKLNEDEVIASVSKKIAIENSVISSTGHKRTADNDDTQTNPSKKMAIESPGDDSFNFVRNSNKKAENGTNLLNFLKPLKRKLDQDDENELFNFVTKKVVTDNNTHSSNTHSDIHDDQDESDTENITVNSTTPINEKVDITALRGAKLSELLEQNSNIEVNNKAIKVIKSEENDSEELGTTVVVVRNDLIIKREPFAIKEETESSSLKNFKKFKKVWPLKLQASMSKLSLSV